MFLIYICLDFLVDIKETSKESLRSKSSHNKEGKRHWKNIRKERGIEIIRKERGISDVIKNQTRNEELNHDWGWEKEASMCVRKMRQKRKGSAMMIEDLRETIFGTKSMCTPHSIMSQKYIKNMRAIFLWNMQVETWAHTKKNMSIYKIRCLCTRKNLDHGRSRFWVIQNN